MKTFSVRFMGVISLVLVIMLSHCKQDNGGEGKGKGKGEGNAANFNGTVTSLSGTPLEGVTVELQGTDVQSDKEGKFSIAAKSESLRYVLNLSSTGFGFVSKIYTKSMKDLKITMAKSTDLKIDLKKIDGDLVVIQDRNPDMQAPANPLTVKSANPLSGVPFVYDRHQRLIDFQMPASMKGEEDALAKFKSPKLGAKVEILKSELELSGDDAIIEVSIQTIDLYSADGMPGDNTVRLAEGCNGYMKSFGAMNFEIKQNGKPVKLKNGAKARVTIPVDTISILTRIPVSPTIPFLTYNRSTGIWEQDGTAVLNKKGTAYEGFTTHFSSFNMDQNFSNPACAKICNGITTGTPWIEVSAPYLHNFAVVNDCPTGTCAGGEHAVTHIDPFGAVAIRMFDGAPGPTRTLLSTYVLFAGAANGQPSGCDYSMCGNAPVTVTNVLDNTFVKSTPTGFCNIQLAAPQKTQTVGTVHTIRLAWLFDDDFSATTAKSYKVEMSLNGGAFAIGSGTTTTGELVNHYDSDLSAGNYAFRITRLVGAVPTGNPASVTFTLGGFGDITAVVVAPQSTCF